MTCPSPEILASMAAGESYADHVKTCLSCQRELAALRRVVDVLEAPRQPDPAFVRRVMAEIDSPRPRTWSWGLVPALASVPVLALVLWVAVPSGPTVSTNDGRFTARGEPVPASDLVGTEVFVHQGGTRQRLQNGATLRPGDGLSATATNLSGARTFLCVFARDAAGVVHWIYPAYLDASAPPTAVPVTATLESFPDGAVLEDVARGPLEVVSAFFDDPIDVRAVEAMVARDRLAARAIQRWSVRYGD